VKVERTIIIVKDFLLFGTGLAGIVYQQVTGEVHAMLLAVFTIMVGLPGVSALWTLRSSSTTSSPSPSSQPQPPSPDSHSSSTRV
jgi:hypothetical protein